MPVMWSLAARRLSSAAGGSRALVVGELDRGALAGATLSAVTAAKEAVGSGGTIDVLLAGHELGGKVVADTAALEGVAKVLVADKPALDRGLPEVLSSVVLACHSTANYTHLVAGSSTFGKNLMPRVAALLDVAQVSDILSVKQAPDIFTRPIYAGNAIATVRATDPVKVMTVRPTAFTPAAQSDSAAPSDAAPSSLDVGESSSRWISEDRVESDRPELGGARVVVSGGRGMKTAENFQMLEKLADKLGAAIGATRAAVDAGMCSNDMQVGQTGKVVAPDLYLAIGLSGAVQHLAGMKDSKTIVAINKDPDSPIFSVADYGLVDDLFTSVPALIKQLE